MSMSQAYLLATSQSLLSQGCGSDVSGPWEAGCNLSLHYSATSVKPTVGFGSALFLAYGMQPNLDGFPGRVNSVLEFELKQPNSFLASQWDQSCPCKVLPKLFLVPLIAFSSWKLQNKHTLFNLRYAALRTIYPMLKPSMHSFFSCAAESKISTFYYYCLKNKILWYLYTVNVYIFLSNPYQMLPSSGIFI